MNVQDIRRKYAETLRTIANVQTEAILEAFARVPREDFLGPPPWQVGQAQPFNSTLAYHAATDGGLEDIPRRAYTPGQMFAWRLQK